jgi:hypothetical protein
MVQNPQIYYRYRLSDNVEKDTMNVNGKNLNHSWMTIGHEIPELHMYIRTKDNPENIIDFESFDRITQAIIKSSWVDFKKFFPYYSRETLASMPRKQLEIICNSYNIPTANLRNEFLINKLLQKQEIFKVRHDEEKAKKQRVLLEEVADKAIKKILEEKLNEQDLVIDKDIELELKEKVIEDLKEIPKLDEGVKKNS